MQRIKAVLLKPHDRQVNTFAYMYYMLFRVRTCLRLVGVAPANDGQLVNALGSHIGVDLQQQHQPQSALRTVGKLSLLSIAQLVVQYSNL